MKNCRDDIEQVCREATKKKCVAKDILECDDAYKKECKTIHKKNSKRNRRRMCAPQLTNCKQNNAEENQQEHVIKSPLLSLISEGFQLIHTLL